MGRPIIGITCELEAARWGDWVREAVVSPVTYTRAVERAGGAPVVLPPVPPDSVTSLAGRLDGLLFAGGRDVDPALYNQERLEDTDQPEHRRDRFELMLMRAAIEDGVPFLAVGRGLHVLNVACGGTLIQHLPAHRQDRVRYLPHDVLVADGTSLGCLLGGKVQVPAAHHQAPDRLGDGLTLTGWSPDDDVVEAVEVTGHPFGVAVHWHPEEGDDLRLLTALVEAAAAAAAAGNPRQDRPGRRGRSQPQPSHAPQPPDPPQPPQGHQPPQQSRKAAESKPKAPARSR